MKRFQRILFCIERLAQIEPKLEYLGHMTQLAKTSEVHFLHIKTDKPAPGAKSGAAPPEEVTTDAMREYAQKHFAAHGHGQVICEVIPGEPLIEILRYATDKEIDLMVLGRLHDSARGPEDEALFARRLTRKATCSVFVLPADTGIKPYGRILCPVRDSECSANALHVAAAIGAATGYEVICLNVFRVSAGYSSTGMSLEEYEEKLHHNAEQECDRLIAGLDRSDVSIRKVCMPDLYDKPVEIILEAIKTNNADIVVIGARGLTGAAGVLLGNTTSHLIQKSGVPVMAVKKKGECLGIVQALLTIAGQG